MTTRRPDQRLGRNTASRLGAAFALGLSLLVVTTAAAGTTSRVAKAKTVTVRATDTGFILSSVVAPIGNVTFVVRNVGKLTHTFRIAGHKTPVLKPKQSAKLVVTFKRQGYFPYVSTLPGQAKKGLKGRFTVAPPGKTIVVRIRDTGIALSSKAAPAGWVTFVVMNLGKVSHDFRVGGKKTALLTPRTSVGLIVKFAKAGSFAYTSKGLTSGQLTITGTTPTTTTTTPTTTSTGGGNVAAGKTLFVSTCGACHTLKAAGTVGTVGTNLDSVQLPLATIIDVTTNGKTGAKGTMVAFKGTLTSTQIADVAAFIYSAEHS